MLRLAGLLLVGGAAGYAPATPVRCASGVVQGAERCALRMGAPSIVAKKAAVVDEVKEVLEESSLLFCARSEGIPVNKINDIRQKLPEGSTMRCVKNTLIKRATESFDNFPVSEEEKLTEYSNYWFFVPETEIRETVELWQKFTKDNKFEDNEIIGGVFEGEVLDEKGITAVTKLPTKKELMASTAGLLKQLPTKLARSLKAADATRIARGLKAAQGQKLATAVKLMGEKLE